MKVLYAASIVVIFFVLSVSIWYLYFHLPSQSPSSTASNAVANSTSSGTQNVQRCLAASEYVSYPLKPKINPSLGIPASSTTVFSVKNRVSSDTISNISISDILIQQYHPVEVRNCGIYVLGDQGGATALFRYTYFGNRIQLLPDDQAFYQLDFRIDPTEQYMALIRGYLGSDDFAFVIKNIAANKDSVAVLSKDVVGRYPALSSTNLVLDSWSNDGEYFWGRFQDGANTLAFIRIQRDIWKYEIFMAPATTMGGDQLNADTGYITYRVNAAPWTGDPQMDQYYVDQARKTGAITSFGIYDLFNGIHYLIATSDIPTYFYHPQWLSDTELQYTLQNGATEVFSLPG